MSTETPALLMSVVRGPSACFGRIEHARMIAEPRHIADHGDGLDTLGAALRQRPRSSSAEGLRSLIATSNPASASAKRYGLADAAAGAGHQRDRASCRSSFKALPAAVGRLTAPPESNNKLVTCGTIRQRSSPAHGTYRHRRRSRWPYCRMAPTITVNSSSGLCCPDHMLKAIGERFEREGQSAAS